MGLLNELFGFSADAKESETVKRRKSLRNRICRIEEVERREFLSVSPYVAPDPINVGVVYHEDYYEGFGDNRGDEGGDTFIVAWNGGAEGTTLDKVVIDLNKDEVYPNSASVHFNTGAVGGIPNGYGTYYDFNADLSENVGNGIAVKSAVVSQDGKTLTIEFEGFTSDKRFFFKIDVDEIGGERTPTVDRLVTGKEMEGATVSGTFSQQNYEDNEFSFKMFDFYSDAAALKLGLPPDAWYSNIHDYDNSAGALGTLNIQTPLRGSISGYVYEDVNNDGIKASGEAGIGGVWLELYVLNEKTNFYETTGLQTTTNDDGYYIFENIQGGRTYKVVETQPDGYADGKDTPGTINGEKVGVSWEPDQLAAIHIGANEHGINYNFGELKRASISGYVYHDRNNDGNRDPGEEGIVGVTLKLQILDALGQYVDKAVTTTNADGYYIFGNLDPFQTYRIIETQPSGWTDGKDSIGSLGGEILENDKIGTIVPKFDQHGVEYNFGEYKLGSIGGTVYEDDDNDGQKDPGEKGIPGVEIWLCVINENGEKENIAITYTDEDGNYFFDGLEPGKTYCVTEMQPDDYCDGITTPGNLGGEINVEVPAGYDQIHNIFLGSDQDGINYNFGEGRRGSLSGYVYEDADKNGVKNAGEKGIEGVLLTLWVWDGTQYIQTSKATTTDDNGYYEFTDLCPFKTYQIREAQPIAYDDGEETVGTLGGDKSINDVISGIDMPPGGTGTDYNFGELVPRSSISGYVYVDANKDGVRNNGETGIGGVTLTLRKASDPSFIRTTTTNSSGYYIFNDLDPNETYIVSETQPTDYDDGLDSIGTINGTKVGSNLVSDQIAGIAMPWRGEGINYNFGEWIKPPAKGSISGYVYADANKNGTKDDGEAGIAGVTLTLRKADDPTFEQTATTNSSGYYIFNDLDPNETYTIDETQPTAYDDGADSVGTINGIKVGSIPYSDRITGIFIGPGQHGINYNFGEMTPTPPDPLKGSISGYVYHDINGNGKRLGNNEPGIAGVTVALWRLVNGTYVDTGKTATTDASGYYSFIDLDPNQTYRLVETQPADYEQGTNEVGSLGGNLAGVDVIAGIFVGENRHGTDYNFGEVLPILLDLDKGSISGYVYVDQNKNGVRNSGEPGITGVTITLTKTSDPGFLRTATTDSNGFYIFANLDPNEVYHLAERQPAHYDDGRETIGSLGGTLPVVDNDTILNITVLSGANGTNYNFGEFEIEPPPPLPPLPPPPPSPPPIPTPVAISGAAPAAAAPNWQPPYIAETLQPSYGGGGLPSTGYSWHLSVVNGGYPRADVTANGLVAANEASAQTMILEGDDSSGAKYVSVAWTPTPMDQSDWLVLGKDGKPAKRFTFGPKGGIPVVGDFNGDGIAELAVFFEGNWYIDLNGNGVWDEGDLLVQLGTATDQPIAGDWDGDGKVDVGIFGPQWSGDAEIIADEPGLPSDLNDMVTSRPKNMPPDVKINANASNVRAMKHSKTGQTRLDVIDHVFEYGEEGDQAFTGDFSGDGITKIGIYRNGKWFIDYNGNGRWDDGDIYIDNAELGLGTDGIAVVGDWTGDGIDKIGLYVNGVWHLDTAGNFKFDKKIEFGQPGDKPVVGDFDGDGVTRLAVVRPSSGPDNTFTGTPAQATGAYAKEYQPGEQLQRHGRTKHTPHTDKPLHRHRDR